MAFERSTHTEDLSTVQAKFETSMGNFTIDLFADKSPMAVWNFINLAEGKQETDKKVLTLMGLFFTE